MSAATRAARLSLSPTLISSTATVSFSLMIGRTRNPRSVMSVFRAFRYRSRWLTSSWVRSTWATRTPCAPHACS